MSERVIDAARKMLEAAGELLDNAHEVPTEPTGMVWCAMSSDLDALRAARDELRAALNTPNPTGGES